MSSARFFARLFLTFALLVVGARAQNIQSESQSLQESAIQATRTIEINGRKVVVLSRIPSAPNQASGYIAIRSQDAAATGVAPVPTINQPLAPAATPPGGSGFTLTVNGSGFVSNSVVNWNGTVLPTTFVNQDRLTASVPAAKIASDGTASVTVTNPGPGGGISNPVPFTVTVPTTGLTFSNSTIGVGLYPSNVVVADFNNDGKPDLAVVNANEPDPSCHPYGGSGTISILLGNGDGTFSSQASVCIPTLRGGSGGFSMATGDFNGDGNQDLVVSTFYDDVYGYATQIFLGNGDGTFTAGEIFVFDDLDTLGPFIVGDFNGDGKLDLAFPYMDDVGFSFIAVLYGNGDGTFSGGGAVKFCNSSPDCPVSEVVAGDFNEDGILDLAAAADDINGNHVVNVLLGNGNGTFTLALQQPSVTLVGSAMVTAADLDGDAKLDLAIADTGSSTLTVLHGNGDGTFTQVRATQPTLPQFFNYVTAADLNGDGKLDLAFSDSCVSSCTTNTITAFLGNGDGTFQAGLTQTVGNGVIALGIGDFNGDGRLDIVTANSADNTISILLQAASGNVNPSPLSFANQPIGTTSNPLAVVLSNQGSAPMTLNSVAVSGDYQIQSNRCATTVQPGGNCNVSVIFTPTVPGSRSGTLTFSDNATNTPQVVRLSGVGTTSTTTPLTSSLKPSHYGQTVVLTAVVVPAVPGTPTGSVTFYDGGNVLASVGLSSGTAALAISTLTAGSHSLTASYPGDGTFGPSTSRVLTQIVARAGVGMVLTSSPNPSYMNQSVQFTAIVAGVNGGIPTGSVNFQQGAVVLGTVPLVSGDAVYSTSFGSSGTRSITAVYSGDLNYLGKTSEVLKQAVDKYTSNTSAASSVNPSVYGQAVNLTSQVTSAAPNQPTGTVTFKNGQSSLGTVPLVNGFALLTKTNLPAGTLAITATYNGDTLNGKSNSDTLSQVVSQTTTTTTVDSSPNPSAPGQNVKFKATVNSPTVVPVGTVTFTAGTTTLGQVSLAGGKASLATSVLPAGTATVTATYDGTDNIAGSSGLVVQTVNE